MKRFVIGMILCFCIISMNICNPAYAAEVVNPCTLTATPMDSNGRFTVNLNLTKPCVIQAFKFEVSYNRDFVQIVSGSNQFGYYVSFQSAYTFNHKGLLDFNHVESERKVIFAGAQPDVTLATMGADNRCAYIQFQLKTAEKTEANYMNALNSISMLVKNLTNENGDIVNGNEAVFHKPLVAVGGDSLRGESVLLGDANKDGNVTLADAQLVLKAALGIVNLDGSQKQQSDVDFNGTIALKDAQLVLKAALGIVDLQ